MFIMVAGVGIIGALASILASLLVGGGSAPAEEVTDTPEPMVEQELVRIRNELAEVRQLLDKMSKDDRQDV